MSVWTWTVVLTALVVIAALFGLVAWSERTTARDARNALVLLADGVERSSLTLRDAIGSGVYPALARLHEAGLVQRRIVTDLSPKGHSGRARTHYQITEAGRIHLREALRDTRRS